MRGEHFIPMAKIGRRRPSAIGMVQVRLFIHVTSSYDSKGTMPSSCPQKPGEVWMTIFWKRKNVSREGV